MRHIENANTKLSLPVFVAIAEALEVSADTLLYDAPPSNPSTLICEAGQRIVSLSH